MLTKKRENLFINRLILARFGQFISARAEICRRGLLQKLGIYIVKLDNIIVKNAFDAVNNGAGIAADDFDIGRLIDFAGTYKPNKGFRQWANSSEFMFMPILLAASASRKRYGQRLYDRLLQPVVRYLLA